MSMPPPADASKQALEELARLRAEIEQVDRAMIRLIAQRVGLARRVGAVKHKAGLPALDPGRESAVIRRVSELARDEGAPEEDIRSLYSYIIGMSRRVQSAED